MKRPVKIIWSPSAVSHFSGWIGYIARYSVQAALKERRRILFAVKKLRRFPLIGRMVPEFESPDLREIITSPLRIIYRVRDKEIRVLAMHHERRELDRELFL